MGKNRDKILVFIDSNESFRSRNIKIKDAIQMNPRFELNESIPGTRSDLFFVCRGESISVELKDFTGEDNLNSDFLGSVLNGHLAHQILTAQEEGDPFVLVILGGDQELWKASAKRAIDVGAKGDDLALQIHTYQSMADGFEANCIGLNVEVWHLQDNPFPRILQRIEHVFDGGQIDSFRPKAPKKDQRKSWGLATILGPGIGPKKAAAILEYFDIKLVSKKDWNLRLVPGIGEKHSKQIREMITVEEQKT